MSEATYRSTPGGTQPSFKPDIIVLDDHPDRDLLLFCACLARMRGQLEALERCIQAIPAVTIDGRKMKALTL